MPDRVFNFSPGPAVMPLAVLERAQRDLLSYPGFGMSVLEMSHRGPGFLPMLAETKQLLTDLLGIPNNYKIIFLQGGSRLQFSMVPANLLRGQQQPADFLVTGAWSKMAIDEAKCEGKTAVAWDGKPTNFDRLPKPGEAKLTPNAAYTYFCSNETIQGVQFKDEPDSGSPLVCDASSDFLHRPLPIAKYGLLYACAQKNAGSAGVTVVIIRDDLAARSPDNLPGYLNYQNHIKEDSLYNTPPTFAIYLMKLVLEWLKDDIGGLAKMHTLNKAKAQILYDVIDSSNGYYRGHAQPGDRSLMNVTFRLPSEELEQQFVKEGEARALDGLKGHRSVRGIRASIYNAMPLAGIESLANFMKDLEAARG